MNLLLIDNAPRDPAFNQPLIAAMSALADYTVIAGDQLAPDGSAVRGFDAVVVSGVPRHYAFETIEPVRESLAWLHEINVPVVGICLGHQAIGTLFGAELIRDTEAELGERIASVVQADPIFDGLPAQFPIEALHRASITVPEDFRLLASTAECRNQMMRHVDRPIYSMQFHPELSEMGRKLLANFVRIAAAEKAARNLRSNEEPSVA